MIIIGHRLVPFKPFYRISAIENIKNTTPNAIVLFDFSNESLLQYCTLNAITFAVHVDNLKEACIANAAGAKYLLVDEALALHVQHIANEYLFDSKILLIIKEENHIENAAKSLIDGIILESAII